VFGGLLVHEIYSFNNFKEKSQMGSSLMNKGIMESLPREGLEELREDPAVGPCPQAVCSRDEI